MALPLEKTHPKASQKATQARGSSGTPASLNDRLVDAMIAASAKAAPFDANEQPYPEEAEAFVAALTADPDAARAYLQSLGIFDEQGKLRPEYDQE